MPYTNLILKVINSPWTVPTTDVTVLTKFPYSKFNYPLYEALDKNFIYLRGEVIYDTEKVDDTVTLKKINGNDLSFDVSSSGNGNGNGGDATEPITVEGNLELQGTSPATTSQAIYGINVITGASSSDFATRLPEPTTGRHTVFVNTSDRPILVFPSVSGGKINGVIDGNASIPNDGTPYTFYCIQNPLPGAWTWSTPAIGQLIYEVTADHTNGVADSFFNAGIGTPDDASVGLGWGGGIIETGTWNTNNFPAWLERIKVYTNIKYSDFPALGYQVLASYTQGYQPSLNGTTTGNKATFAFTGTQNYPGNYVQEITTGASIGDNVGDLGTLYMDFNLAQMSTLYRVMGNQCLTTPIPGNMGQICYSTGYYTFNINIPANMPTKEYKFQFFVEYS